MDKTGFATEDEGFAPTRPRKQTKASRAQFKTSSTAYPRKEREMIDATLTPLKRGLAAGSAKLAGDRLVGLVRDKLGDSYPTFFLTPLGQQLEVPILATVLLYAVKNFKIPHGEKIEKLCTLALEGAGAATAGYLADLVPLFAELGGLTLGLLDDEV